MRGKRTWVDIEALDRFRQLEEIADEVWKIVHDWNAFARDTVGKQLVRAIDSIGANLAEGDGRYHHREKLHFCYIARGSLKETCYWLRRAQERNLLTPSQGERILAGLETIRRWINTLISQRRKWVETSS